MLSSYVFILQVLSFELFILRGKPTLKQNIKIEQDS